MSRSNLNSSGNSSSSNGSSGNNNVDNHHYVRYESSGGDSSGTGDGINLNASLLSNKSSNRDGLVSTAFVSEATAVASSAVPGAGGHKRSASIPWQGNHYLVGPDKSFSLPPGQQLQQHQTDGHGQPPVSPGGHVKGHRRNESTVSRISEAVEATRKKLPFGFRLPLCCREFKLPSWRFSKTLEWRSQTKFEGRLVTVCGSEWARQQILDRMRPDPERTQTEFSDNEVDTAKYTPLTFFPRNLFEQFRRGANFYFLCNLMLTLVLEDSPIDPTSWLMSLVAIVAITMLKQGYEDYLRHQSDREVNERLYRVLRAGELHETQSQDIRVGDIVHLKDGEAIPCDLVVLSTASEQNQCYVMTANLDGETSLKTRYATELTKSLKTRQQLQDFVGFVECENPNPKLDNFLGRLTCLNSLNPSEAETCSLTQDNLLLSGTVLKNVRDAHAVCVYAGMQTKMSLNSKITRIKFSTIERSLNVFLIFFIALLLSEIALSTVLSLVLGKEYFYEEDITEETKTKEKEPKDGEEYSWYLGETYERNFKEGFNISLVWLVLYSYVIPISMYVSIECQKFISSMFFAWDINMYDEERDIPAKCNTSDINEELGLVTHLFTDKTGTLTRNIMVFQMYSRDGMIFNREELEDEEWGPFMMILTLCHSVQVSEGHFAASSPDEKALLDVCKSAGFVFRGQSVTGEVEVSVKGTSRRYQRLADLEFDSFRKCMTVIVRCVETGVIHVLSKGAEVAMLPACVDGPVERTERIVDGFATDGLRTLVFAAKTITEEQLAEFEADLETAKQSIVNRAKYLREVYKAMEAGFTLVGATGIEDRLQERVVETMSKIRAAGIIPWMLTGDKKETALNLANAAGIVSSPAKIIDLCEVVDRDVGLLLDQLQRELSTQFYSQSSSLIVDGKSILTIMKSDDLKERFLFVCQRCPTVVACRLSPIQKSQLVRMIKDADPKNLTAAIGDGGNDISMIQEAHVGLGIIGLEGTAAAKSSDFAFSKFCHLQRALFVHGHWYYRRLSFLVQYSFYKNVACMTSQFFFAMFSNWSGQSLFESFFLFMFNTWYTLLPVVIYSIFEQNFSQEELTYDPKLYRINHRNRLMRKRQLCKWVCMGFWHSLVVFFGWYFLWDSYFAFDADGQGFGAIVAANSVLIINLKVLVEAKHWNWLLVLSVVISILSYVGCTLLTNQWLIVEVFNNAETFRSYLHVVYRLPTFLGTLGITVLALTPDVAFKLLKPVVRDHRLMKRHRKTHPVIS